MLRRSFMRMVTTDQVKARLSASTLAPSAVTVTDISGGCGSFFKVEVEAAGFAGKPVLAQHRLVQGILKAEIAEMHGITVVTTTPAE
jgi:stress-induced morphogen